MSREEWLRLLGFYLLVAATAAPWFYVLAHLGLVLHLK